MGIKTFIKQSTVLSATLSLLLVLLMPCIAQAAPQTIHLPASGAPQDVFQYIYDEEYQNGRLVEGCAIFDDIKQMRDAAVAAEEMDIYDQLEQLYTGALCRQDGHNISDHPGMGSELSPLGTFANPVSAQDEWHGAAYAGLYQLANVNQIPIDATICSIKAVLDATPIVDSDVGSVYWYGNFVALPQEVDPNVVAPDIAYNSEEYVYGVNYGDGGALYAPGERSGGDYGMTIYDGTGRIPGTANGSVAMIPGTGETVVAGLYDQPELGSSREVGITPDILPTRGQLDSWQLGVMLQQDSYGTDSITWNPKPIHWVWSEANEGWEADQFSPLPQLGKTDAIVFNKFGADVTYSTNGSCDEQSANSISVDVPTNPDGTTTTPVTITTPTGTTITCSSGLNEATQTTKDASFNYPLGLVQFCFDTPNQNNAVNLTYITNLKPQDVVARKYNPNNNSYFNIENATITQTTIDNQPALSLTYTITDNGDLDLDPTPNKITDPVGLATLNTASPNTGLGKYWLLGLK